MEKLTGSSLLASSEATLTAQDLQDSLVEQSLSETILLQNVNFDPNLFDGLNLDLDSNGCPNGSNSASNNLSDISLELGTSNSLDQLNLLDSIELQILKEVQLSSQASNHAFPNSSDPLVSSTTTTAYSFTKQERGDNADSDSVDLKYLSKASLEEAKPAQQIKTEPIEECNVKPVESGIHNKKDICGGTGDGNNSISQLRAFASEKVFVTTGPIPSSVTALSLANMKVVGPNVLAIISDQESGGKRPGASLTQTPQARLIIIEDTSKPAALRTSAQPAAAGKDTKPLAKTSEVLKNASKSGTTTAVKEAKGASNVASSTGAVAEVNQFTDADSNSGTPSSKQFVPCKVCGDKASGYHYGVTSCEGCKGFFRRSIQKQIEYRCLRDGKCMIIRLNRNRCQFCRFRKCLSVGMSRDSVRYGRVPKKSKEKERLEEKANGVTQAEADQSSSVELDSKDLALYDTILTISQAHHANCSYTEDKIKGLSKKAIFVITSHIKLESSDECSSSPDVGSVSESLEAQKIELWEQLALLITPCIQRVVEFAKRLPGFSDTLTQDDQLILIKLGFFEVWLVHISKTANFVDNTLTFADGSFLNRKQMELMFDHDFVGNIFHLMSGLNSLSLSDTEIGLFTAIILLQSDRPQIYDIKAINKIQENVIDALKVQINRNHGNDPQTFHKLMLKINELRALGSSHSLHLQWFRSNWPRLKLPPLFAEIFDIPKGSSFVNAVQPSSSVSQTIQGHREPQGATTEPVPCGVGKVSSPMEKSTI